MHHHTNRLISGLAIICIIAGCGMGDSTSTETTTTFKNQSGIIYGTVSGLDQENGSIVAVTLTGSIFGLPTFQDKKLFDFPVGTSQSSLMFSSAGLFIFSNAQITSFDIEARFYDTPASYFTSNSTRTLRSHFDGVPLPAADITETIKDNTTTTVSLSAYPTSAAVNINYLTDFAFTLWTTLRAATPGLSFADAVSATNTLLRSTFPTSNLPLSDFAKEPLTPAQSLLMNKVQFETYSSATSFRIRSRSDRSVICAGPIQQPLACTHQ